MKNPLVSIIVAAYNEEDYILKLINSIISQSYQKWELIIVDDNSTDKTFKIIKSFSKKNKKIKVYKQKKSIRGPGSAWNLAIRHSNGKILFFEGADTILGKDYIKEMIAPILKGQAVGTLHKEEMIANKNNIWARAFGKRACVDKNNEGNIFGAILKEYYDKTHGFDPKKGYADDQTLYEKLRIKSLGVEAEIYHHNPQSLSEIWRHHKWVGSSYEKPILTILVLPIFPVWIIYKSLKQIIQDPYLNFIWFLPFYNTIKYFGYFSGALRKLFTKKIY